MSDFAPTRAGDSAAVSVRVAVSRDDAFDVFTREIDLCQGAMQQGDRRPFLAGDFKRAVNDARNQMRTE